MKWRFAVVALAVAALIIPLPAPLVERAYSSSIFPLIQSIATPASNLTALAWFDIFIVFSAIVVVWLSARDLRSRRVAAAFASIAMRLVTVAAVFYLLFLASWGLNYRRQPLREKVPFDAGLVTADALLALARETVARLNDTYVEAHNEGFPRDGEVSARLAQSFARTSVSLGLAGGVVPARPKRTVLDLYFRRAGVAGMTDPFFLETLVASDLLPFERPMVVAHEWSHLAGVNDEGEANFVGWLTCVRGDVPQQYSGWLFLYSETMAALPRKRIGEVNTLLGAGPRADLEAIRQRYAREVSPRLSSAGWQIYDQYLKANRVDAGTASYTEVVRLVLGTKLR